MKLCLPLFVLPLLAASPFAQVVPTDHVVGWSVSTSAITGQIDVQDIDGGCQTARRVCGGVLTLNIHGLNGGGTAWDAARQAVWVTNGSTIAVYSLPTCQKLCEFKAQLMNASADVTGLAISDSGRRLFQLESSQGYAGLRSYDIRQCPPTPLRDGCTLKIQSNSRAGGLAYDEARDLLYIAESFPAFVGHLTNLHVARAANKCQPVCMVGLKTCGTAPQGWGPVEGLAYQPCSGRLYATDGVETSVTIMNDPLNCKLTHVTCCKRQLAGNYRGLAALPGWAARKVGTSCLPKGCRFCSSMSAALLGEPSLGNPAFGFLIDNGPAGNFAFLVLGAGCGNGLQIPIICAPLYPLLSPPPIISPVVQLAGSTCTGSAKLPLPLPVDGGLCGLQLCSQWLVICGPVLGATEAIEFKLVGS